VWIAEISSIERITVENLLHARLYDYPRPPWQDQRRIVSDSRCNRADLREVGDLRRAAEIGDSWQNASLQYRSQENIRRELDSISERVREIGIRKSVGAGTADIFIQILVEALVIALLGGLAGLVVSFGLVRDVIKG